MIRTRHQYAATNVTMMIPRMVMGRLVLQRQQQSSPTITTSGYVVRCNNNYVRCVSASSTGQLSSLSLSSSLSSLLSTKNSNATHIQHQHQRQYNTIMAVPRSLSILPNNEVVQQLLRSGSSSVCFYGTTTTTATTSRKQQQPAPIKLPPNVIMDPKSSFVTQYYQQQPSKSKNRTKSGSMPRRKRSPEATTSKAATATARTPAVFARDAADIDEDYDDDDEGTLVYPDEIRYAKPLPDRLKVDIHTLLWNTTSDGDLKTQVGTIWLDDSVFGCDPVRIDLLKRSVDYYRAKKRGVRKAHTKTVAEVSGSGRKIRQQKGTGRARAGHSRPPHFRGGATAHGPNKHYNTDYGTIKMNKKTYRLAMRNVLSQKLKEGNLILLNDLCSLPTHKTKDLVALLKPFVNIGSSSTGSTSTITGSTTGFTKDLCNTALLLDHYYPEQQQEEEKEDEPNGDIDKSSTTPKPTTTAVTKSSYRGVPINFYIASSNLYQLKVGNALSGTACNVYDILKYNKLVLTLAALQHLESRLKE